MSWECRASDDEEIDLWEPMEEQIATKDIYGNWIPSPSAFKWNFKETVPLDNNNNEVMRICDALPVGSNNSYKDDEFSTRWALSRKK